MVPQEGNYRNSASTFMVVTPLLKITRKSYIKSLNSQFDGFLNHIFDGF